MRIFKYLKTVLCSALIQCLFIQIRGISNNPGNQIEITEDERRAAEKLETEWRPFSLNDPTETQTQGIYVQMNHRGRTIFNQPTNTVYQTPMQNGYISGYSYSQSRPGYVESVPNNNKGFPYFVTGSSYPDYSSSSGNNGSPIYGSNGGNTFYAPSGANGGGGGDGADGYGFPTYSHTSVIENSGDSNSLSDMFKNAFSIKGLLLPLAGLALLGAAAALTSNPVLLQLGVIGKRRRRRRSLIDQNKIIYPENPFVKPHTNGKANISKL